MDGFFICYHKDNLTAFFSGLLLSYPEFLSRMVKLASKPFREFTCYTIMSHFCCLYFGFLCSFTNCAYFLAGGSLISQIPPALQSLVLNVPIPMENIHEILDGDDPPPISSLISLSRINLYLYCFKIPCVFFFLFQNGY